ncbi:HFX_2341 family transcriptional regulator domain-containing protein [Halopelagius longus]|uniref:Uncharacterized protein n=1 Tax=Halopelagius longus TaxID=1236180 RepID=A0A1H0YUB9_9EURY|nr:DUF6293 family protein [Halopelagius longus]RDI72684.1 hypothetical protein DWB78_13655 [Halopelagius longus]SDQ18827.1 hypothetical protein SAMN05216278_0851 [Halopelagius longus]
MNATLPSGRRVHIAPLGYERDRVVEPARREAADVVYLLVNDPGRGPDESGDLSVDTAWTPEAEAVDWDAATPYQLAVREELDEFCDARGVPVRIRDVYDVMGVATTIAARHDDDQVFVNISSGPNVAAVGAAIACMTTDALPYSVTPESYGHDVAETPLTRGVAEVTTVPDYPIESPTREQVHIMGYLYEMTVEKPYSVNKRNLIDRAEDYDLPFLDNYSTESRQSEYRRLDAAIIDPLREKEYIRLEPAGKQKNVVLTETGISVYRAFQHKILDE